VTARAVKAGQVLFEERPLVVGPSAVSAPQCLQCALKVGELSKEPRNTRTYHFDDGVLTLLVVKITY
jgi:hypothetical protein